MGCVRTTISAGELRASDIFELLPFENALVAVELIRRATAKLLQLVTAMHNRARVFNLSGTNRAGRSSSAANFRRKRERAGYRSDKFYTIVTIDYLLRLGSGAYAILQEGKNTKPLT